MSNASSGSSGVVDVAAGEGFASLVRSLSIASRMDRWKGSSSEGTVSAAALLCVVVPPLLPVASVPFVPSSSLSSCTIPSTKSSSFSSGISPGASGESGCALVFGASFVVVVVVAVIDEVFGPVESVDVDAGVGAGTVDEDVGGCFFGGSSNSSTMSAIR